MTQTTMPAGINAALADLQTQLPHIAKDNTAKVPTKTGGGYVYKYADLAQISREVLPLLGKLGLSFTSRPTLREARLVLVYELRHISGELIEGEYPLPANGSPQEIGGAITYARRYCLCAVTGVAPDDDDEDAVLAEQAARHQRVERQKERVAQQDTPPEPRITAAQQRSMQELFPQAGVAGDKAKKLEFAIAVVKRKIGSATELTQAEADKVIGSLTEAAERRSVQAQASGEQVADEASS